MSNTKSYNQDLPTLVIRRSTIGDEAALERLAQLEGTSVPAEPLLLAQTHGEVRAALSLTDGKVIADPFWPTAKLVEVLHTHATPAMTPGESARRKLRTGRFPATRALWPI